MRNELIDFVKHIIELIDELIFICDDDFKVLTVNNSAKNFFPDINEIIQINFFSLPIKLINDDFESFLEKIFLMKTYTGEIYKIDE